MRWSHFIVRNYFSQVVYSIYSQVVYSIIVDTLKLVRNYLSQAVYTCIIVDTLKPSTENKELF